jgi:hypothetical protein
LRMSHEEKLPTDSSFFNGTIKAWLTLTPDQLLPKHWFVFIN